MILDEFPELKAQFEKFNMTIELKLANYILNYSKQMNVPLDKLILVTKQSFEDGALVQSYWVEVRDETPVESSPKKISLIGFRDSSNHILKG
jgi:hypothetical protein